jgi:Raf kinase inhibitor-like YbhB/YbcL family protein
MQNYFMNNLVITSPSFSEGTDIPVKFSCKGENISPAIKIGSLPAEAKSLAVIVEDPDAPRGIFDHWVVWNLQPLNMIAENSRDGVQGKNGSGGTGYTGPCPPSGTHRYLFKVYALDSMLDLPVATNKRNLMNAMKEHVIAGGELTDMFSSQSKVSV